MATTVNSKFARDNGLREMNEKDAERDVYEPQKAINEC